MSKIQVPSTTNTKFDPLLDTQSKLAAIGLTPVQTGPDKFSTSVQQDRLNQFSNINMEELETNSLYSNDPEAQAILTERRAQNQGAGEQLFKGLGHMLSTAGTEVLKIPGYVGGLVMAAGSEVGDIAGGKETNSMESIVNNMWVNAFEDLDEGIKAQMPVYLTKEVEEGNIGRKLKSSAWWSTVGADGIGFLISMYAPGQLLKALGAGEAIGAALSAIGKEGKLAKMMTSANILKNTTAGAQMTQKGINNLNSFTAVAANTFIESAAEAANTFDNAKTAFLTANPRATEEEASIHAGNVAANVMKANMLLLPISNMLDELFLFKGFDGAAQKMAQKSIIGKMMTEGVFDVSKIKRLGIKEALKQGIPKLVGNFAKEGFFEEGLQTEVQKHYEDEASGKTKLSFMEDVVYNYFDDLATDPEMQESVVLGGILGGGASVFGVAGDIKNQNNMLFGRSARTPSFIGKVLGQKEQKATKGLAEVMNTNFINSFRTINDIAEKDAQGNVVTENGKVKVDENKLNEMMQQKDKAVMLNQMHNLALIEGDEASADMYGDMLTFNYFLPFFQQEGGYTMLKEHINTQLTDAMEAKLAAVGQTISPENKEITKKKLMQKAEEFNKVYTEVNTTTNPEMFVRNDDKEKYSAWKQQITDKKMQSLLAYNSAQKNLTELGQRFDRSGLDPLVLESMTDEALTSEQLDTLSPVDIVKYRKFKAYKGIVTEMAKAAKDEYVDLTTKEGLRKSYADFKEKVTELQKETAEELTKEQEERARDVVDTITQDQFIDRLTADGNEIIQQEGTKGFYVRGENVLIENPQGQRYTLRSQYISSKDSTGKPTSRVEQVLIDKNGKTTVVTDANGNLSPAFLKIGFAPVSKEKLALEGKALRLLERKKAQLALIDEIVSHRTNEISNSQQEIADIETDLTNFTAKVDDLKKQADQFYKEKLEGKVKPRKQVKLNYAEMLSTLASVEQTIVNLTNRRAYLESRIPKLEVLVAEYSALRAELANSTISLTLEKQIAEERLLNAIDNLSKDTVLASDIVVVEELIDRSRTLVAQMNEQLDRLVKLRDTLRKVIASHGALLQMLKINEKQKTEAIEAFNKEFEGIPFPYSVERILNTVLKEPHEVLAGETLVKNNIITNAEEIAAALGITPEAVFERIQQIFAPFALDEAEAIAQYGLSPQEIYELRDKLWATNKEINELRATVAGIQSEITVQELNKRYLILEELNRDKVKTRFNQIKSEQDRRNLDKSQTQTKQTDPEPIPESNLRSHFLKNALPLTPYSTTGKNVLYNKEGDQKGKDQVDDQGFPTLNDNVFQRTWFLTVDKLANDIQDYTLLPVHARYDSSDEYQKAIEANFPDASQRGQRDVFVFLLDKEGKPVMVDNNGSRVSGGGNLVFTSIRKADEVFPPGEQPRIVPDTIFNGYLQSLGIPEKKTWETVKNRLVGDTITSKVGRQQFKDDLDKPVTEIMEKAIEHARTEYEGFIDGLIGANNRVLSIEGVTRGFPLYQMVDGKRKRSNPLTVFQDLTLTPKQFGTAQLNGGKLGTIIDQKLSIRKRQVELPAGSIYLQFPNDDFVLLQSRKINTSEAKTVLYLLSLAANTNNLNTVSIPFPKKKDGSSYYYFLNRKRMEGSIPVFYRKSVDGVDNFSLLHSLINYGSKPGIVKNGEIYIQSGKVVYQKFDGRRAEVNLTDLQQAIQTEKFEKYSDEVGDLFTFLLDKRFNVNRTLMGNNPIFMYPTLNKVGKGQFDIKFDTDNTYYEFLFGGVLTTSATKKAGYPQFLQRNVVYKPELVAQAAAPTAVVDKPVKPTKPKPAVIATAKTLGETWLDTKIANAKKVVDSRPDVKAMLLDGNTETREASLKAIFEEPFVAAAKKDGQTFTEVDMQTVITSVMAHVQPKAPSTTPAVQPAEDVLFPEVEETIVQKINKIRSQKTVIGDHIEVILKDGTVEILNPIAGRVDDELLFISGNMSDINAVADVRLLKYNPTTLSLAERIAAKKGTVDLKPKNKAADEINDVNDQALERRIAKIDSILKKYFNEPLTGEEGRDIIAQINKLVGNERATLALVDRTRDTKDKIIRDVIKANLSNADKRVDPDVLLEQLIQTKEIKKECL